MGESPPIPAAAPPEATSPFTKGFFSGADEEEDEMPPFVLPADVGVEIEIPLPPIEDVTHLSLAHVHPPSFVFDRTCPFPFVFASIGSHFTVPIPSRISMSLHVSLTTNDVPELSDPSTCPPTNRVPSFSTIDSPADSLSRELW